MCGRAKKVLGTAFEGRNAQSEEVQNALDDAASRITTIAQVHDHLWRSTRIVFVDIDEII
jgi:two-component sensor histidine kinase